jgi:hypothetical protein
MWINDGWGNGLVERRARAVRHGLCIITLANRILPPHKFFFAYGNPTSIRLVCPSHLSQGHLLLKPLIRGHQTIVSASTLTVVHY